MFDSLKRTFRRVAIFLVFALIIGGASYLIFANKTPATCSDNIKNQNETGIDCGGSCRACINIMDLLIFDTEAVPTKEGFVDLFAEIQNKNLSHGISSLNYRFDIIDRDNQIITSKEGFTFVLPNSKKFIIEVAIAVNREIKETRLAFITPPIWQKAPDSYTRPQIIILSKTYKILTQEEPGFAKLQGIISNRDKFDFDQVNILAVIRDDIRNSPIAVAKQPINTLLVNQNRAYKIIWFHRIPAFSMQNIEIIAETNIFDNANYLKPLELEK